MGRLQGPREQSAMPPLRPGYLLALSRSSLHCSSSRMYFCSWSRVAPTWPSSSSRAEICRCPSACCLAIFS